jgi:CPA2 family monovalent cation:H+ antiporter-2
MHASALQDITIILGAALAVTLIFHRLKIPEIIGFLITGTIIGPSLLGLVKDGPSLTTIAEVGVILLLFTIGLEFSLKKFFRIRRLVLLGGGLQVLLTVALTAIGAFSLSFSFSESLFFGFILSMSSTVIVLSALESRRLTNTPPGVLALAILLFQDIAVVPMALIIPLLAADSHEILKEGVTLLFKFAALGVAVYILHKFVIGRLMNLIAKARSQEIFTIGVFAICMGGALLTGAAGMSLPLGAFIAGLILSESEYGYQASNTVHSFRNLFSSFFFVSVGMMFNPQIVFSDPITIGSLCMMIFAIKWTTGLAAVRIIGFPARIGVVLTLLLGQIGEFSFVLAQLGVQNQILSANGYQVFLAASIITMILSPAFISIAPALAYRVTKSAAAQYDIADRACIKQEQQTSLTNHIIIIGYGINGRNLALAAKAHQIPYIIIETNPETVAKEKAKGEPIIFGDASFPHVLEKAGINQAKILCVLIADPFSTRKIVDTANRISPGLHIIVRSRQVEEVDKLLNLGADEVIPEEFETSLEIFSRVLRNYLVPEIKIEEMTEELRQQQYLKLANPSDSTGASPSTIVPPDLTIETVLVGPGYVAAGSSLQELDVRNKYGVTIIGIHRQGKLIEHPSAKEVLLHADYVFVLGKRAGVHRFAKFLLGAEQKTRGDRSNS